MAAARGRGSAAGGSRAPPLVALAAFLCLAVLLLAVATPAAEAGTTYLVGDAAGWTLRPKVDYGQWVAGKTFHAGDILVFKYNTTYHDVAWVSKGGYRNCIVSPKGGRAPVYHTGHDAVTLPRGTHYFICGTPGHCSAGMKLAVTVY